jgi:uncharacterized damage-inducible protein DinB
MAGREMKDYFAMFALYNRWANERLYEAAAALSEADYRSDRGAFFGSLHGTLNHLVVADRIWMRRFTREGPVHTRLDDIACGDLPGLAAMRRDEDERIISYVETLTESDIAGTFTYSPLAHRIEVTQPLASALAHFFNHQTHHRGQAHGLLTAIGGRNFAPSLDLVLFQRETGVGMG